MADVPVIRLSQELPDLKDNFLHASPWPASEAGSYMPLYLVTCSDNAMESELQRFSM